MPRTTHEEIAPEPPPAEARDEFADLGLTPLPPAQQRDPHELDDRTEAELVALMSQGHKAPELARAAWSEMYHRHVRYVTAVVRRAFGERTRDPDTLSDIVNDAFQTVFDWAARHGSHEDLAKRFEAADRDGVRSRVLGFHAVVARRLASRRLSVQAKRPEFTCDDIDQVAASDAVEDLEPLPATQPSKLERLLELLSSEEAEALRVSLPWYQPETGEFAFPRGEAARVAASLGITPEALRQRRCRSLKHLQALLGDE